MDLCYAHLGILLFIVVCLAGVYLFVLTDVADGESLPILLPSFIDSLCQCVVNASHEMQYGVGLVIGLVCIVMHATGSLFSMKLTECWTWVLSHRFDALLRRMPCPPLVIAKP